MAARILKWLGSWFISGKNIAQELEKKGEVTYAKVLDSHLNTGESIMKAEIESLEQHYEQRLRTKELEHAAELAQSYDLSRRVDDELASTKAALDLSKIEISQMRKKVEETEKLREAYILVSNEVKAIQPLRIELETQRKEADLSKAKVELLEEERVKLKRDLQAVSEHKNELTQALEKEQQALEKFKEDRERRELELQRSIAELQRKIKLSEEYQQGISNSTKVVARERDLAIAHAQKQEQEKADLHASKEKLRSAMIGAVTRLEAVDAAATELKEQLPAEKSPTIISTIVRTPELSKDAARSKVWQMLNDHALRTRGVGLIPA